MNKILLLFLSFVLAAGAAQSSMAQDMLLAAANAETVKAEGERVRKKKIGALSLRNRECRKVRSTGSRIPERVCRRESEWRRIEENSRQSVEDSLERSRRDTNSLDG